MKNGSYVSIIESDGMGLVFRDNHGNRIIVDDEGSPLTFDETFSPSPQGSFFVLIDSQEGFVLESSENVNPEDFHPVWEGRSLTDIDAAGGRINIAAAASAGEVIPTDSGMEVSSSEKGDITISEKILANVSGEGAGSVFIRGGQFIADASEIRAKTIGDRDGGVIDIHADAVSLTSGSRIIGDTEGAGKGSDITIEKAEHIWVEDRSAIFANTHAMGQGGDITLIASESVIFSEASVINTPTTSEDEGAGDAGNVRIETKNITFADGSGIHSSTIGRGNAGEVILKAEESVSFFGEDLSISSIYKGSRIHVRSMYEGEGAGDGGRIEIEARNISFEKGAYIESSNRGTGNGGDVILRAKESVSFIGEDDPMKVPARIWITTEYKGEGGGDAGSLEIEADNISFSRGPMIFSGTVGKGRGGDVTLKARDTVFFSEDSGIRSHRGRKIRDFCLHTCV